MSSRPANPTRGYGGVPVLACWSVAPIFIKYLTGYVDL